MLELKKREREKERERKKEKKRYGRNLAHSISGYTCSMAVSSDRIRSPPRNERNDSELYQRSTWSLHLTTVAAFVRARGVSADAEVHEIRFTWTGISQIGFVRSRITFFSSTGSRTQAHPSPSKWGNNYEKRSTQLLESHQLQGKLTFPAKWDHPSLPLPLCG